MVILTTWILWAIIETANPNVNGFAMIDEFKREQDCVRIMNAIATKGIPIPPKTAITGVTLSCIPVATRISKDAH